MQKVDSIQELMGNQKRKRKTTNLRQCQKKKKKTKKPSIEMKNSFYRLMSRLNTISELENSSTEHPRIEIQIIL